jgi:hypothetical protein
MAHRTHQLAVDRLESRDLMAGNVTAVVSNNVLFLRETAGSDLSNAVRVFRLPDGRVRVVGLADADGVPTTINGAAVRDFWLPNGGLSITLRGGDDRVVVEDARFTSMHIDVGGTAGSDRDTVEVRRVATGMGMHIFTGNGDDAVTVTDVRVGHLARPCRMDLTINTGFGADAIALGSDAGGSVGVLGNLFLTASPGLLDPAGDAVDVRQTDVGGWLFLRLGSGDDRVAMTGLRSGGLRVSGLRGNDVVGLTDVWAAQEVDVSLSDGDDRLDLTGVWTARLVARGGAGTDRLVMRDVGPAGPRTFSGWESSSEPIVQSPEPEYRWPVLMPV